MGTLTEEILSRKVSHQVFAGDSIVVDLDHVMSHDTTTPLAIEALEKMGKGVWDREKAVIVFDHIVPASTIKAASLQRTVRDFVNKEGIDNFYQEGICHQLMIEKGHAIPGAVIVGADSHSCTHGAVGCFSTGMGSTDIAVAYATGKTWLRVPETINLITTGRFTKGVYAKDLILDMTSQIGADGATYRALEYSGATIREMSIEERMTMTSMAVEMGAKNGVIQADNITMTYTKDSGVMIKPEDPQYLETIEFDAEDIVPKISGPDRVDRVDDIDKFEGMAIDQIFVGTCTNGRLSDLRDVARILKHNKINRNVRMVVVPASLSILREATKAGYIDIFYNAGVIVGNPGCGPCIGRHQGVLAPGEVALTTMNRNFKGRMGSADAEIYLSSPVTAALSAINGKITDPREVLI